MIKQLQIITILSIMVLSVFMVRSTDSVLAAQIQNRSLTLSDSLASATNVTHRFNFDLPSSDDVGSIELQYCSNDPFPGDPCTAPSGLDLTSATLTSQSGETGFSIHANSTANRIVLTRSTSAVTPGPVEYVFDGVTNPDQPEKTYYVRLGTFASTDGTGARIDEAGLAISTGNSVNVTTEVPPYLEFCVGLVILSNDCSTAAGNYIDFGTLSTNNTKSAISKFQVATNAAFGYRVKIDGTTLYSGKNPITPMQPRQEVETDESQFGINLRANNKPNVGLEPAGPGTAQPTADYNVPDEFKFKNGEAIVDSPSVSDTVTFTASYVVNISDDQVPGVYTTTLTYVCTATF